MCGFQLPRRFGQRKSQLTRWDSLVDGSRADETDDHGLQVELPGEWWIGAEMTGFVPRTVAYRVDHNLFENVQEVRIEEAGSVRRNAGVGIFNNSEEQGSARERVLRILRGFRSDNAIPPVEIVEGQAGWPYRYKLIHGAHRFYCSLAAGFKCVPTIEQR